MLKTLIIADDSTGANASAILLKKLNLTTLSLIDHLHSEIVPGYEVIAISTDSRAINPSDAFARVSNVLYQTLKSKPLVINKRIDSTLRGNVGSELNAFKEALPYFKIAIIPAFPSSQRVCIDGVVYVGENKLQDTDAAKDPKMPINTSVAKEIFEKQFIGKIANIYYNQIIDSNLETLIIELYNQYDAIIFDAKTNEDIEFISKELIKTNLQVVCVDPGPFTYFYTKEKIKGLRNFDKKYIFLVGSVVDTTFEQLKEAYNNPAFDFVPLCPKELSKEGSIDDEISKIILQVQRSEKSFICITSSDPINRVILNLHEIGNENACSADDVSKIINHSLAKILTSILIHVHNIGGVFTSGGDVTLGFLNRINARGINLLKEVMPLCVYGKIVGGEFEGFPIITKGGMIGPSNSYIKIKDFFEEVENYE